MTARRHLGGSSKYRKVSLDFRVICVLIYSEEASYELKPVNYLAQCILYSKVLNKC